MKTSSSRPEQGSVLLVTMIFVLLIGAALYGYLAMIQNSNLQVARAQAWNSALPVAEAGIDEGLAKLNTTIGIDTTNKVGGFSTILSHSLDEGTYHVRFNDYGNFQRYLTSTGIVSAPVSDDPIIRIVKVGVQRQALFSKGMVALGDINMNGHSIASSSWNSHDPNESNNGYYDGYIGTNGDIASVYGYVNLGQQYIYGSLYLGPNATYDNSGHILGTVYTDSNLQYPDVTLPTTDASGNTITWTAATTTTVLTTNNNGSVSSSQAYVFTTSGYYIVNDSTTPIIVDAGVTATVDAKSSSFAPTYVNINGGTADSGTLVIYQESGSMTISGNSSGGASSNRPENYILFGLPGVTSITYSGTSDFIGVIYAPEANLTLNGGGDNWINLNGSVVVHSVTLNGKYAFHYDTSLSLQYWGVYVVGSWQEL